MAPTIWTNDDPLKIAKGAKAAAGVEGLSGASAALGAGLAVLAARYKMSGLSARLDAAARRAGEAGGGPAAAAAYEPATGQIFTGVNSRPSQDIHELLAERLSAFLDLPGGTGPRTKADNNSPIVVHRRYYAQPGEVHAEVQAVSQALHAREAALGRPMTFADLGEIVLHIVSVGGPRAGIGMPRCSRCSYVTQGVQTTSTLSRAEKGQFLEILNRLWPSSRPF